MTSQIIRLNRGLLNVLLLASVTIAAGFPVAAFAQDRASETEEFEAKGGVYVSLQGGVSLPSDSEYSGIQAPAAGVPGMARAPADVRADLDNGGFVSGAIGYRIPKRFFGIFQPSVELEVNYTDFDVSGGNFNGGNQTFGGDQNALSVTANYQSDIRWSNGQKVIPFLGGGIGVTRVDNNILYFPNNGIATSPTFVVSGRDTGFTTQSNIGVTFVLTNNIELTGRARYQRTTGLDFDRRFIASDGFNAEVGGRFENVTLAAGLRYRF